MARRPALARGLWAASAAYAVLIFYLSSQANPLPLLTASVSDKILHGLEYAVLGALVSGALLASGVSARAAFAIGAACAALYGASDELHQRFVPGRDADVRDWAADVAGALGGAAACVRLATRPKR